MLRWLRRRVTWETGSADERAAMARAAIWLLGMSGVLGLIATATMAALTSRLPTGALLPSLGCTAIGAALLAGFERLSPRAVEAAVAGGTLLSALSLALGGDAATGMEVYFLWAALFAAFFLGRRQTLHHLALSGAAYAGALASSDPAGLPGLRWLLVMTGVGLVGLLVRLLRERSDALTERLAAASRTDPETGLLNRRGFVERLDEELARSRRSQRPVALVITDVDRLQALNDRLGHAAGDRVIAQMARTLAEHRRATDIVGRIGADEVAMVLPETDEQAALIVVERLRRLACDAMREQHLPATIRAGIATRSRRRDGTPFGHRQPLRARDGGCARARRATRRARPARGTAARHRKDRDPRCHPAQAGPARRCRVARDAPSPRARRADARRPRAAGRARLGYSRTTSGPTGAATPAACTQTRYRWRQ
jgi:diguanylate cyclase (GGDEF)-like protein